MPVYRALTAALAPFARRRFARQAEAWPVLAGREDERRGQLPDAEAELWIHAASVGELNAARPLIERLRARDPTRGIVLSTLTPTAAVQAAARYADDAGIRTVLAPLDRPRDVAAWLDRTRPDRLLLIETELWPELLTACHRRGIPVAMANARLSARAARRYRSAAGLFAPLLAAIAPIACQSRSDADRFARLGARREVLTVTGNVKFDPTPPGEPPPAAIAALDRLGERPRWVAGSTHRGEETIVAEAQRRVVAELPEALLLLVPRHPERTGEAERALAGAGLSCVRWSEWVDGNEASASPPQAVVIDRLGLLGALYHRADAGFVGGSLVEGIGGHNLIEAAQAGRPVLTGPFTDDQAEAAEGLDAVDGLARVTDARSLGEAVIAALGPSQRGGAFEEMPRNAAAFLAAQRGALDRTLAALDDWLDDGRRPPRGA
ncbi:3-deoxy-D-manno-octulosonic acid transferase [Wenzhouxiangella sp. XN79A]|uniref:3-deoxy-D-manno-octulosonic acid transferase n=1 Tax=Wenzhouxiangella sp. XN79A TaxID=2724193 RepID=UPI00144A4FE7|nr:glycosyltransferase N-terminal domain-containing protein [Wenzhouxiangella sp. XN79A]NKI33564.1 3-deoxy-D-manno-octulosonic acid transferase [Wenzhouxiangella sp. XN79A]